ncbi:MAG: PAS domain S-box protein [Campylobacterales bacterium]
MGVCRWRTVILIALFWAIASAGVTYYLQGRTQESLQRHLGEQTATQQVAWEAVLRLHNNSMTTYFEEYALSPKTLEILRRAQDPALRDEARRQLGAHLAGAYRVMRSKGIRQLHFHLPDGESFLRFHHPQAYGDNLFAARPGIQIVNTEKRSVSGFEAGKVMSGFRNIFPIITATNEHLGSVELSLPFEVIRHEIAALQPNREFELIISRKQLEERLFEKQKQLYGPWAGSADFWVEDPLGLLPDSSPPASNRVRALSALIAADKKAQALIASGRSGSVALRYDGVDYTATFTAARDIEGHLAGFLIGYRATPALGAIKGNFNSSLFSGLSTLTLLALTLWMLLRNRRRLQNEKERLQTLYETLGEGLYVTDSQGRVTQANQSALKLLGFELSELAGQEAHGLFHADGSGQPDDCPIYQSVSRSKPFDGTEVFRRKDGSRFNARIFSRPLHEEGKPIGAVTTFSDVTEEFKIRRMLQTIYDVLPVGITLTDPQGNIVDCNAASEQILGITREEHLKRNYSGKEWAIIRPDGTPMPPQEFASVRALKEGCAVRDVEMGIVKPGGVVWISVSALPVKDEEYGVVVAYVDITERKAAQEALIRSEERWRFALEGSGDGIWDWNAQTNRVFFSRRWKEMLGYGDEEIGDTLEEWSSRVHPEDIDRCNADLKRHFEGKTDVYINEHRMRRKDGSYLWILDRGMVIERDAEGKPLRVIGTHTDIDAQKRSEALLRDFNEKLAEQVEHEVAERLKSEAKYKHLFNAVPDAIMVHGFEPNGMPAPFSEVNEAACAMTGLTREALLRLSPAQINPHRTPEETARLAAQLQETGHLEVEEVLGKGGSERTVLTMARIVNVAGQPTVITVARDVTELKKLERDRELQQAVLIQQTKQAELGGMIGAIAHQWKQPLNAIGIMTQGLIDSYDYNELDRKELETHVAKVMNQVQFMSQTITDFRNFYKPAKQKEPFSPLAAIRSVAELLKIQLDRHHVQITIEGDGALQAAGYASEFKQVVLNLINNARDALEERGVKNGEINIRVDRLESRVVITLCDNGGGIAPELLPERLFEPFHSTKGEKGTGIGLSLSRTIIENKMSGRLKAANTETGACFTIELPAQTD